MRALKALSVLLSYPTEDLRDAIPEIRAVLAASPLLGPEQRAALDPLLARLASDEVIASQEAYVLLFDRSRTLSLNLFEHVHGESRDRGSAMVDLLETYRAAGYDLDGSELPDHLPVLLEFLATQERKAARETLADAGAILVALAERLTRRGSDYAPALAALVAFARASADSEGAGELLAQPLDDPEDLVALDKVYEEAAVTFGPDPDAGCPVTREMLARMAGPGPAQAAE